MQEATKKAEETEKYINLLVKGLDEHD